MLADSNLSKVAGHMGNVLSSLSGVSQPDVISPDPTSNRQSRDHGSGSPQVPKALAVPPHSNTPVSLLTANARPCRNWRMGRCKLGTQCRFSHDVCLSHSQRCTRNLTVFDADLQPI